MTTSQRDDFSTTEPSEDHLNYSPLYRLCTKQIKVEHRLSLASMCTNHLHFKWKTPRTLAFHDLAEATQMVNWTTGQANPTKVFQHHFCPGLMCFPRSSMSGCTAGLKRNLVLASHGRLCFSSHNRNDRRSLKKEKTTGKNMRDHRSMAFISQVRGW